MTLRKEDDDVDQSSGFGTRMASDWRVSTIGQEI